MAKSARTIAAKSSKPASVSELASPAPEGQETFSLGGLDIVITSGSSIPANALNWRATRPGVLPFPELFDRMAVGQHSYLPDEFWEKRQAAKLIDPKTELNTKYVKDKVRTSFERWRKADEKRAELKLVVYHRPSGISPKDDPSFPTDPRPGHSLYITDK